MDIRSGIIEAAKALQMPPEWLATYISYETGGTFDPMQPGPTTQWGQHRGLIQFGEPQAQQYGVNWADPIVSQLGPDGAVVKYFLDRGWKPGMSFAQGYSTINAGNPHALNASDAHNGGAPGTVLDKVNNQMAGHWANAARLLGGDVGAFPAASGGGSTMTASVSTKGAPGSAGLLGDVQPERPSLFGFLGDPERRYRLAMMLDGMTLNPNPGLQGAMASSIKEKQDARSLNRTAEFFIKNGRPDLAEALMAGASPGSLMQTYLTKASSTSAPDDALAAATRLSEITGLPIDSPMIQAVILNGGDKAPANFLALHAQAVAAGLQVGSPEYEQFMLTRGAGDAAEAKAAGTLRGEAGAAIPGIVTDLRANTLLIDELLNDPALDSVVGGLQGAMPNISPGAVRVQSKINQLLGKAYLAAREELRGTGQITEREAEEARNAYTRLQNLRLGDEDYRQALLDFKRSLNLMLERSMAVASGAAAAPTAPTPPAPPPGRRIRFNERGERE